MSTNFYHRYNRCEHCERYEERHIGKSSMGWQFSFRAYYDDDGNVIVGSYNDWKEVLKSGDIFDEYGTWYRYDQFFERVDSSKGKQNHYDYIKNAPQYQEYGMKHLEGNYKDDEGWDFSKRGFC